MERRLFIYNSSLVSSGLFLAPELLIPNTSKKGQLTILHTNDTHSAIEPFPANHQKYPSLGGVVQRAGMIDEIRRTQEHVLLLDAGDVFQGTPYFNEFKGVLEMKAMSQMRYDVGTLGNHDFDIGMKGFLDAYKFANFPIINANYGLKNTLLDGIIKPNVIIQKGKYKIGVFGLGIDLVGLISLKTIGELIYHNPIEIAQEQVSYLKNNGCNFIICLSHLGYSYQNEQISDIQLAQKTSGINLILGGHTHTFLPKPTEVTNLDGKTVLVNQVGYAGIQLGRIDFLASTFISESKLVH